MKKVLPLALAISTSCLLVCVAYFYKDIFLNDAIFGIPKLMYYTIREMFL